MRIRKHLAGRLANVYHLPVARTLSRAPGDETDDFIGTAAEFMLSNWSLPPWQ